MDKTQISAKIAQLRGELKGLMDQHKDSMPADVFGEVEKREAELKGLNDQLRQANELERIAKDNASYFEADGKANLLPAASGRQPAAEAKTLGKAFVDSVLYGTKSVGQAVSSEFGFKTLFQTSAGWAPAQVRSDVVALSPQRALTLLDYLPSQSVSSGMNGWRYMLESTFTNASAETAEDGTYAESALALTEQVINIRKVGTTIPLTEEQMADVNGIETYLNNRLSYMLKQKFETQILNGSGTSGAILGLTNFSGVLTTARGTKNHYDAIYAAITSIRNSGFTEANLLVVNPTDWQTMRLLQTSQGQYIWDSPQMSGGQSMFGMPVIVSAVQAQGTCVVMDASQASVLYRDGIEFVTTNSHASEFTAGVLRLRADLRGAVALFRSTALCTVTGL